MIVVFDSNIWLSQLGLRSGPAAAAKFYINYHRARLAIPEVVRLEVERNLRNQLTKYIDDIRENYQKLLTAFGTLKEVVLPTPEAVEAKIAQAFASIDVEKIEVPLTLDSARSSFLKTIDKVPPSHRTQQFKDGVLWADCMQMLSTDSVVLVTDDKAFYQEQKYEGGAASNLRAEIAQHSNSFTILPTVSALLQTIRSKVTLDEEALAAAFLAEHKKSVFGTLERNGFDLGPLASVVYTLFATESPRTLFLEFEMTYSCTDVRGEGRTEVILRLKGDGFYEPSSCEFSSLRNFGEHLTYRRADGSDEQRRNVVVFAAGIVIGHKEVSSVTRYKLDS